MQAVYVSSNCLKKPTMKTLYICLIFILASCASEKSIEENKKRLIYNWTFVEFQKVGRKDNIITVNKTKYAENISFEFKDSEELIVSYSNTKQEKYLWKFIGNTVEIITLNSQSYNSEIVGRFELYYMKNSELFLQRRNDPHHGILLKL